MTLLQNTISGLRYKCWSYPEAFAYFIKGIARELRIAPSFFSKHYERISDEKFKKKWLKQNGNESYFDFNGVKLPDISNDKEKFAVLKLVFEDVFLIPCYYNDNYDRPIVELIDQYLLEGPYGYVDGAFDVTIKKNDVVIDAGAWIGDFSAYSVSKEAIVYAFEPVEETFRLLCKTKELNNGKIYPIQKGLGNRDCEVDISINKENSGSNTIVTNEKNLIVTKGDKTTEKIFITTLDKFVKENKLEKVDFIKADIEGAEREMLRGASHVLKTFAPKLAICTYHLPDDPEILEKIILDANPNYTIVHLKHKLLAAVIK
jgi:FkbM family methyltransferase